MARPGSRFAPANGLPPLETFADAISNTRPPRRSRRGGTGVAAQALPRMRDVDRGEGDVLLQGLRDDARRPRAWEEAAAPVVLPRERRPVRGRDAPPSGEALMRVCTGGTFDILHAGHEALLAKAFELGDEEVLIGITSDRMARKTRKRVNPLAVRRRNLRALLRRRGLRRARPSVLEDLAGPAAYEEDLDAIVVSADRIAAAAEINRERVRRGHKPMDVVVVPMLLAEDCLPIGARRIRAGDIDRHGRMARPLVVRVGSTNPVKVAATKTAFRRVFRIVNVRAVEVPRHVRPQPF